VRDRRTRAPGLRLYPRDEAALRHGAGVDAEITSPREAYAPFPPWVPGPPASLDWLA
jgi:hypothetical protein